jgi:hypothetical protein
MRIYDAQIWAVARVNGVRHILTEDVPGRAEIEGVRYHNPFSSRFRMADLPI